MFTVDMVLMRLTAASIVCICGVEMRKPALPECNRGIKLLC